MNYQRLRLCFYVLIPADIAMVFAGVPMVLCCFMNIACYFMTVPFPVSREDLRELRKYYLRK